jgi:division protein CdvB (Snf7/Vps24/ESCRT-III family)
MRAISGRVKLPELNRVLQSFAKESSAMELMSEMVDDALDAAQEDALQDEDEEQVVQNVLDEIGIELGSELVAPRRRKEQIEQEEEEFALKKLQNLKAPGNESQE